MEYYWFWWKDCIDWFIEKQFVTKDILNPKR
jgi:hypothetical protein